MGAQAEGYFIHVGAESADVRFAFCLSVIKYLDVCCMVSESHIMIFSRGAGCLDGELYDIYSRSCTISSRRAVRYLLRELYDRELYAI